MYKILFRGKNLNEKKGTRQEMSTDDFDPQASIYTAG